MEINIDRLRKRIEKIANISTGKNSEITRLALTKEDKEARNLLMKWLHKAGAKTRVDDFGNIYGRFEGKNPHASVIMTGSHIDTVPNGGKFDGVLGVLGSLEVLETMKEKEITHHNPIEIVSFTNEEGVRFSPQMLGSGAVTGEFSKDYTYNRIDNSGLRFEDELKNINFNGEKKNRLKNVSSFIEMHIEQGPILDQSSESVGIVTGISGFAWLEVNIIGEANHSGTTPMNYRKDSLVASSQIINNLNNWANDQDEHIVATVGTITSSPNSINVIPSQTNFTVDMRCPYPDKFNTCIDKVKQIINDTVNDNFLSCKINEIRIHPPVIFSDRICSVITKACLNRNASYRNMFSGAGHDAMYMSKITDTAMIFLPSINGISHSPNEETAWNNIEEGLFILYETLLSLSK